MNCGLRCRRGRYILRVGLVLLALALHGGCTRVEPWQRGRLARPDMVLEPDAALAALRAQIHDSKEAAGAGGGGKAGGCGCN
ncbi:MAG: DUF4266 domain-containing protein [Gammaproteobacteria bacterium]